MEEADIIKGCLSGNQKAYKALVDTYSAYLFAICKRYVIENTLAQDCLQESLIQIINKIHLYEERGKFKSWMGSVTVKKCLDILRKEKRHISAELDKVKEPMNDELISLKLEKEDVMRFLETIPSQYRIAVNMFLVEGYSHKEIGNYLGITESSSRSLVSRARKMVAEAFDNESMKISFLKRNIEDSKLKIIRS
ncbi:MAG: RNA polymerase sigma factor [Saprospiraceae bacterium]|nr:RNA polymerase sigma factor [Bacteroidia bacterium]NNE16606.1 RNA polymerase sigma factor [Saprospiraceae bacterium]NNL93779.1 RNA polymerase sigma factor [Saprospiraceae bacterium]